jgi:flagellar export protein FliJ
MSFHFQLEGVLRLRSLLEDQACRRLDESMMHIHALEHSLAEAIRWSQETARVRASQKLLPAAEMQFIESVLRQTQESIVHTRRQKQCEEERAAGLRAAYLDARRERETVSTLRDNALARYQAEQSRRQQSTLDEIFLGKLIHSRNAARQGATTAIPNQPEP